MTAELTCRDPIFYLRGWVVGWEAAEVMWRKALIGVGETARGGEVKCGFAHPSRYCKSLAVPKNHFPTFALGAVRCSSARPGTLLRGGFGRFCGSKSETDQDLHTFARNESNVALVDYSNLNSLIAGNCHRRCTYSLFPRPGVLLADGQKTKN